MSHLYSSVTTACETTGFTLATVK
ncbi:hypothetical protein A2U01_0087513, partial [Trifolium medium]|nr:hypothetical protein [Trifolium medium]